MLQINTKQSLKQVEVDGFAYQVRKPGAGESLTMQKTGREITKLGKLEKLTESQSNSLSDKTVDVLTICLSLFQSEDKKAMEYIQTLDVEVLLNVINQVFESSDATA